MYPGVMQTSTCREGMAMLGTFGSVLVTDRAGETFWKHCVGCAAHAAKKTTRDRINSFISVFSLVYSFDSSDCHPCFGKSFRSGKLEQLASSSCLVEPLLLRGALYGQLVSHRLYALSLLSPFPSGQHSVQCVS